MRNVAGSIPESVRKFVSVQLALSLASGSWRWVECENNFISEIIRRLQASECSKHVQSTLSDGTFKNCNRHLRYFFSIRQSMDMVILIDQLYQVLSESDENSVLTSEENVLVMAFTSITTSICVTFSTHSLFASN